jgi:TonB family protein
MILIAGFAAAGLLRGASAALRHFLWTAVFAALLLLPAAAVLAPEWSIRPAASASATLGDGSTTVVVRPERPRSLPSLPWLLLWVIGCAAVGLRYLAGAVRVRQMVRRARPAGYARQPAQSVAESLGIIRRVMVLESPAAPVPFACGVFRPVVLLPAGAAAWPGPRLRSVLLHELLHVRRFDVAAQALARLACCLYWFHPLAWIAARQLRREREHACDDAVLLSGVGAHQYASDLMDLTRDLAAQRLLWPGATAMAGTSDLESRIRLLFASRNRRPLQARVAVPIAAAVAVVLLPLAALTVRAQATRGALVGVVQDASGARIPNCRITARNLDGTNQEVTRSDQAGEYRFTAIPPGRYALEFAAPGFSRATLNAVVTAQDPARADANLDIGSVSENLTITGRKAPAPAAPPAGTPHRVRVGGNVQPLRLIRQTKPEYSAELQQLGVQGTVVIRAVISKTGDVLSPQVVNTVDPRLAKAALDAVSLWQYSPSLLNGQPVETSTTVTVDFQLNP